MDKPEIKIAEQPKTTAPEKSKAVEPPKPVIEKKPEPLFVNSQKAIKGRCRSRAGTLTFLMPSGKS